MPRPVNVKSAATNVSLEEKVWLIPSLCDTGLQMAVLVRSPTALVVKASQGNSARVASLAGPRSSRSGIEQADLHDAVFLSRRCGSATGSQPGVFKRTQFRLTSAYSVSFMAASAKFESNSSGSWVLSCKQRTSVHFLVSVKAYLD